MSIFLIITLAILAVAFGAGSVCLAGSSRATETKITQPAKEIAPEKAMDIREQLRKLAKSKPPRELSSGAMCYSMMAPPSKAEYICPGCTNKTLYAAPEDQRFSKEARWVSMDLPQCRRLIKEIKGLNLQLDESMFCKQCSPDATDPRPALVVKYPEIKKTHRTENISVNDLILLKEFAAGSKTHTGDFGRETPLKDYLPRLEQLLGISLKDKPS